ncbi:MAG TPA: acyclic terpene utilization AtuA family protein [Phenylobacterium sp.]|uniref:acyclic terpene utilization AtuA family protein n=1 Tax=Phenylobacterium sp. TaxID=1871053 RepID=UPI002B46F5C1|nr:acyclic terpene utilization AtuA family protein [Phenylobacterium sp.]HKR87446.1 acyclic terpene utilization AtuA family protein [Phenylobacterium sp.]
MKTRHVRRPRIGAGSAFAGDSLPPAVDLAESGEVDYMMFDRLGEATMTQATLRRMKNPNKGYDPRTGEVLKALGGYLRRGGVVAGSFGQANVECALAEAVDAARAAGLSGLRIGAMHGGDVLDHLKRQNVELPELGCRINELGERLICAHAYLGAEGFIELLEAEATFLLAGRIADPSMAVALTYDAMGWDELTPQRAALGTLAGHMLQGSTGISGGGFADPPYRIVPGLAPLGFPYVILDEDAVQVTKLPAAGGLVTAETVKCRVGYEIHDPRSYLTPDVDMDMSMIELSVPAPDVVELRGMRGKPRPEKLRALVGVRNGYKALAEGSLGGFGCVDRAKLVEEIVRERLRPLEGEILDLRFDIYGVSTMYGNAANVPPELNELRYRVAAHCRTRDAARVVCNETGMVYFDRPAGVAGPKAEIIEALTVVGVPVDRSAVSVQTEVVTA